MKNGFTLAEILITLGIIGIVAAMTMPTLFNSMSKRTTLSKLQKAYTTITQAYRMSYNDNGDLTKNEAFTIGADNYFKTYWAPYIKASECTTVQECGYSENRPWLYPDGRKVDIAVVSKNNRIAFYTPEGFLYVIYVKTGGNSDTMNASNMIIIDINGGKAPNTFGKDVFMLSREQTDAGVEISPQCNSDTDATINTNCSRTGNATCCFEKIRRAGWRIDSTYPW